MSFPLICDNGTGYIKIGYSNEQFPRESVASVVGRRVFRAESVCEDYLSE